MRESNFRSVVSNRASVTITTLLYDRRALDCTADRPLINSLNHLTYLASSSARVRETLCVDGGLERLVAILKECRDDDGESKSNLVAWKWSLALQCLVYMGARGSEAVRRRIVDAGLLPVVATILDNFLQKMKINSLSGRKCHVQQSVQSGVNSLDGSNPSNTVNSGLSGVTTLSGANGVNTLNGTLNGAAVSSDSLNTLFGGLYPVMSNTSSVSSSAASIFSTATGSTALTETESIAASTSSSVDHAASFLDYGSQGHHHHHRGHHHRHECRLDQNDRNESSSSSSSSTQTTSQAASNDTFNYHHHAPPTFLNMSTSSTTASFAHNILQASSLRSASHPLHSQASNAVFHAHAHASTSSGPVAQSQAQESTTTQTSATQTSAAAAPQVAPQPQRTVSGLNDLEENIQDPFAWSTVALGRPEGAVTDTDDVAPEHRAQDLSRRIPEQSTNTVLASSTTPESAAPRFFEDHIIVPREEDVIWALEVLAFVTKYVYLKPHVQSTHLVPRLSLRDPTKPPLVRATKQHNDHDMMIDDDMMSTSEKKEPEENWNYDTYDFESQDDVDEEFLGENVNLFSIVERFTMRQFSKEIQYWAGVVMRNSCRKDDSRGGIRQCANFDCGKWEEYPKQFAKCRRCKRSKYCSKQCQLDAWGWHKQWCVPSNGSSSNGSSAQTSTPGSAANPSSSSAAAFPSIRAEAINAAASAAAQATSATATTRARARAPPTVFPPTAAPPAPPPQSNSSSSATINAMWPTVSR